MAQKHTKFLESFSKQLLKLREERGLSQRELSRLCKIANGQISRIENAKVNITLLTLYDLAEALEVEPKELLEF